MKNLEEWLTLYSESHQHARNKLLHTVCVPVIFFVIVAALWKLSFILWLLAVGALLGFYYVLGERVAILGAIMVGICLVLQWILGFSWLSLLILFVVAWAGQFYGHKLEGRKPSFFEDLKFLLIGPLWVAKPFFRQLGLTEE